MCSYRPFLRLEDLPEDEVDLKPGDLIGQLHDTPLSNYDADANGNERRGRHGLGWLAPAPGRRGSGPCRGAGSLARPEGTLNSPARSWRAIAYDGIGVAVALVMHGPTAYLMQHGVTFVFANVMLQQMGAPIPAEPTLVVAGSLAAKGVLSPAAVVLTAVVAALLADAGWFVLGRRYHGGILRLLARLSRSRAQQSDRVQNAFARWGLKALLVAKFLPGVSQVMVPIAGATGKTIRSFIVYDIAGTLLWAALPFGGGVIFHQQVDVVLDALFRVSLWALGGVLIVAMGLLLSRRVQARRRPA